MSITSYGLLLFLLVIIAVVSAFGSCAGYTVSGVEQAAVSTSAPGLLGVIDWMWESLKFMFNMTTFQVDNMPAFLSVIFIIMQLMTLFLIYRSIRGNS